MHPNKYTHTQPGNPTNTPWQGHAGAASIGLAAAMARQQSCARPQAFASTATIVHACTMPTERGHGMHACLRTSLTAMYPNKYAYTTWQSSMHSLARPRMCCVHWTRCCYGQTTVPCHASGICINCDHSPCLYAAHREWTWYARVLACVTGTQKNRSREARSGHKKLQIACLDH